MAWEESAEQAYRRLFRRTYIETGPRLVTSNRKKYIALNDLFKHGERHVDGVEVGGEYTIVEVPDPWQALAAAMLLQHRELEKNRHVLFRGQSSSDYKIVASIYREGADVETLDRAKRLLAFFLAGNAMPLGIVDPEMFYGAAQHYQIWTDLLDVTPDAAVATWFAAQKPHRPCRTSAVYVMPKSVSPHLRLQLPPPFVGRLHRQRGLFLHFPSAEPLSLKGIVELRFPANNDDKLYKFQVIRHGKPLSVLEDSPWIRNVVGWAKTLADDRSVTIPERPPTDLGPELALFLKGVKHAGIIDNLLVPKLQMLHLGQWMDAFNDLLYWLAYGFDDSKPGTEEFLDLQELSPIVASNMEIAKRYVKFARLTWEKHTPAFKYQIRLIESLLA